MIRRRAPDHRRRLRREIDRRGHHGAPEHDMHLPGRQTIVAGTVRLPGSEQNVVEAVAVHIATDHRLSQRVILILSVDHRFGDARCVLRAGPCPATPEEHIGFAYRAHCVEWAVASIGAEHEI